MLRIFDAKKDRRFVFQAEEKNLSKQMFPLYDNREIF